MLKHFLKFLYQRYTDYFHHLLIEEFTGFIPKEIKEPNLKFFEDQSEVLRKWILWQSHFINRRALNDKKNLDKYEGMMIYLKGFYALAEKNKKKEAVSPPVSHETEASWVEKALSDVKDFRDDYGKQTKGKSHQGPKAKDVQSSG